LLLERDGAVGLDKGVIGGTRALEDKIVVIDDVRVGRRARALEDDNPANFIGDRRSFRRRITRKIRLRLFVIAA
jgi:hypothetical protein